MLNAKEQKKINILLAIKITAMASAIGLYSLSVFFFNINFVLLHAATILVFGAFKAGAGFEAISTGNSSYIYVKNNLFVRVSLAISWSFIISFFSKTAILPLSFLGLSISILWLRSFDGHLKGSNFWSIIYSLSSVITIIFVALICFIDISNIGEINASKSKLGFYVSSLIFLTCLFSLRNNLFNTSSEIFHASISPLIVFYMTSYFVDTNGTPFIFYKGFEGMAQVILFLLSSSIGLKLIEKYDLKKINLIMIFFLLCIFLLDELYENIFSAFVFGVFIFIYFIASFLFVRKANKYNLLFILSVILAILILNIYGYQIFKLSIVLLAVTLYILQIILKQYKFLNHR